MNAASIPQVHLTNRLFGMYHSGTADHNKDVIAKSMSDAKSCVCYSCPQDGCTLGYKVVHYGAPRSWDNYLQECGWAGMSREQAFSTIYWCSRDSPMYSDQHKQEVTLVRQYVENTETCRRVQLLKYLIGEPSKDSSIPPYVGLCCDVCKT